MDDAPTRDEDLRFSLDPLGRLVLTLPGGARHVGVEPVRAFPLTDPERGVAVCDAAGREVAWVDALEGLDPGSRALVLEELDAREFLPALTRVVRVVGDETPVDLAVETDRGPKTLRLESDEDVRAVGPHRLVLTDADRVRYQVRDLRALDPFSRRALERYL